MKLYLILFTCIFSNNPRLSRLLKSILAVKLELLNLFSISLVFKTQSESSLKIFNIWAYLPFTFGIFINFAAKPTHLLIFVNHFNVFSSFLKEKNSK